MRTKKKTIILGKQPSPPPPDHLQYEVHIIAAMQRPASTNKTISILHKVMCPPVFLHIGRVVNGQPRPIRSVSCTKLCADQSSCAYTMDESQRGRTNAYVLTRTSLLRKHHEQRALHTHRQTTQRRMGLPFSVLGCLVYMLTTQ